MIRRDLSILDSLVRHKVSRDKGDERLVTDGPFAETTEQLGGFYLVEAGDLDEALEYAKALPAVTVEVRPVVEQEART